jgi:hypothetical protein
MRKEECANQCDFSIKLDKLDTIYEIVNEDPPDEFLYD